MYSPGSADEFNPEDCIDLLDQHKVAAHYVLDRRGCIWKLVDEGKKAWHAGVSKLPFLDDCRDGVNAFSIGVELLGSVESGFTKAQYTKLAKLTKDIANRNPIRIIVGHEHIAPNRKQDPGPSFDWDVFRAHLNNAGLKDDKFRFAK
jgi:N-acetyl-anhydromuramoyl-L-alanine amidase